MNRRFSKYLRVVAICHIGVVVVMLTTSGWTGMFKHDPDIVAPEEFVVEVAGPPVPDSKIPDLDPKPPKVKEPEKVAEPDTSALDEVPIPAVKTKKTPIDISQAKKITRVVNKQEKPEKPAGGGGALKNRLSPDEIRKLLGQGAKMSDHTSIPASEEGRCFAIVKQTMYDAWNPPNTDDARNAVAEATICLARDGRVYAGKLSKKSGNALFDDSVMQAVNSVQYIEHLTPAFLDKYREISITFKPQ